MCYSNHAAHGLHDRILPLDPSLGCRHHSDVVPVFFFIDCQINTIIQVV